jgi:two-component system CheB/CheR fusion protein
VVRRELLEQKRELQAARALLREHLAGQEALREDYQSTNEEMLSANEELQSTNEELETSKEELQATNEELTTVNDELASNNSTLHLLGNDLKNLLESTVIPIVMVDGGLRIRRMTPTAETVFKVLLSDIGRSITDIRPDLNVDLKPLLTTVLRDVVNLEREVQDQQGHWYRLQIRPYKTLENRIDGAVLVLMDIDVIKKRNQELVLAAEFTKSIIDTMPEPVLVLSADLRILMANQAFYKAFEVEPKTTLNQLVYNLGDGQWNKPDLRVLLEEVLPHDRNFFNHEVVYDFPGIGWKSFMLSGRYMVQEPDAAPLILLSLTDMTKRKKIEAALIQAEKLAIASRLAASIAHEINNPLEAITNLLYLASNGDDAAKAKSYTAQALEEIGRVSHITQQTLKFYRQSTAPSSVQIAEILDSLLVLYNGKLLANSISVHRQYREVPPLLCLAGDLRQIFANIIGNAIDAMVSGGSLTIRVSASCDWRNRGRHGIRTTIADAGIGMNTETLHKIYEPFFTTKNETGTGLGMWVSAQLVERLQGELRVWSTTRLGKSGTAFSLFLPFELSK